MNNKDLDKIKQFPITALLEALNIMPADVIKNEYYYHSPIRTDDKTPSFAVNVLKNCWFDHGAGPDSKGGDIIDLVMALMNLDFNNAVAMLSQVVDNPSLIGLAQKPAPVIPQERNYKETLQLVRVDTLTNPVLRNYLAERAINLDYVKANTLQYLVQVFYQVKGKEKQYYALGFKNSADGYELRSKNFQSFVGSRKTFTFIKGNIAGCAVFESFIDYLSALTHYKVPALGYDILILHSTRLVKQALPILKAEPNIHDFLDNDKSGREIAEYIKAECKDVAFKSHNDIYKGYKDFNDFLTKTAPNKPLPGVTRDTNSTASQKARWWLWTVFREPQQTRAGQRFEHFTYYSFNNHESGYHQLLQLRQSLEAKLKYFRLCERTTGREFKVLEEGFVS